jgi:hypothetical protein
MPDQFTALFGAVLIVAAITAAHPVSNRSAALLEQRIAERWHAFIEAPRCDSAGGERCPGAAATTR